MSVERKKVGIDKQTFLKLKKGDQKAFKYVYDAYYGFVRFIGTKLFLDKRELDDMVQEVFIKVFRKVDDLDDYEKFTPWLASICRNTIYDMHRSNNKLKDKLIHELDADAVEVSHDKDPNLKNTIDSLIVLEIVKAIKSEKGGDTFIDFYILGYTAAEIASKNNEAISTVTSRLSRLRTKFKEKISKL